MPHSHATARIACRPRRDHALLGWGLLTAWGLVSLVLDLVPVPGTTPVLNAVTSLASVAACTTLLLFSKTSRFPSALHAKSTNPASVWLPAAFMAICSVANQVLQWTAAPQLAATLVQIASSFAYIWLMYLWFRAYVPHDPQIVEDRAIWSTGLCAAVFLVAVVVPYPLAVVLWVVLPLLSAACLAVAAREKDTRPASPQTPSALPAGSRTPLESPQPHALPASHRRTGTMISVAVCGFVFALSSNLADFTAVADAPRLARLSSLGGLVLAAVLALWYVTSARRIELASLFKMLYPIAAAGLLLTALPNAVAAVAGLGLSSAGQWALYVFIWIYAVELCHSRPQSSPQRFAAIRIAFDTGGASGALAAMAVAHALGEPGSSDTLFVYALFGGLALFTAANALLPSPDSAHSLDGTASTDGMRQTRGSEGPGMPGQPGTDVRLLDDLIAHRAGRLTAQFGLSEREAQILVRLLKGYSTSSIRNELAIAKGTVDTYIQRIYRKCDVHSRQQLVELAEGRASHTDVDNPAPNPSADARQPVTQQRKR